MPNNSRLRQYEQGQVWDELKAYLQYRTREIFGDKNQTVGVQYGSFAKAPVGAGYDCTNGVLVTFPYYEKSYALDTDRKQPGVAVRWMLGHGHRDDVSITSKKVFWCGGIFTRSHPEHIPGHSYTIAGKVEDLHRAVTEKDPEGLQAALEWDKQRRQGAAEGRQ